MRYSGRRVLHSSGRTQCSQMKKQEDAVDDDVKAFAAFQASRYYYRNEPKKYRACYQCIEHIRRPGKRWHRAPNRGRPPCHKDEASTRKAHEHYRDYTACDILHPCKWHYQYLLEHAVSLVVPYYTACDRAAIHYVKAYHAGRQESRE